MRYMGLDLGSRTLGISLSDITRTVSNTYKTIRFSDDDNVSTIPILKQIIIDENVSKIVLGFPKNMNNTVGPKGEAALKFKELLENELNIEVIMQDERLTTVEATNFMLSADVSRKKRKKKIDSLAANIILQTYLDKEKGR